MFRRTFLQLITLASVGGLAPLKAVSAAATRTVIYQVKGFTCITCATGLDTLLSRQKGVVSSQSTYPEGKATVTFNPKQTSEPAIVTFITDLGFTVQPAQNRPGSRQPVPN